MRVTSTTCGFSAYANNFIGREKEEWTLAMHGGQRYSFQILTAIGHFLQNHSIFDSLAIEGDNHEDSIFFKDGNVEVIGEAKLIESGHWTPRKLFYSGERRGPLLQLWNRIENNEQTVIFSSIPLRDNIAGPQNQIQIDDDELEGIITDIHQRIENNTLSGVSRHTLLNLTSVKTLLENTRFFHILTNRIEQQVMHWGNTFGQVTLEGVNRLLGFINSPAYITGRPIQLHSILQFLHGVTIDTNATQSLDERRSELHIDINNAFSTRNWDVQPYHQYDIYNYSTIGLNSIQRRFEILISRENRKIRYFAPVRSVVSADGIGRLDLNLIPREDTILTPFKLIPRNLDIPTNRVKDLIYKIYENQEQVSIANFATGNLVSHFNPQIEESLEDQRWLFDNLPSGDLIGDSIIRQLGGDMSGKLTILCPMVIIDGNIHDRSDGNNMIPYSLFNRQNQYTTVVTRLHIASIAEILSEEFERMSDFLS